MVASVPTRMGWGAFGVVSALISTVGLGAMVEPAFSQFQQQACVETNNGQVVCGRLVDNYNNRNNRNSDRYDDRSSSNDCSINGFDEQFYRLAYQDVEAAIRQGRVKNACSHYRSFGRYEGRFPRFNEASYLAKNPDVANAVRQRQFRSAYEHWQKYGRFENRSL
jgi:hypothetical protein